MDRIIVKDLFGRETVLDSRARQVEWVDFTEPMHETML
jgi:hypothetical protein